MKGGAHPSSSPALSFPDSKRYRFTVVFSSHRMEEKQVFALTTFQQLSPQQQVALTTKLWRLFVYKEKCFNLLFTDTEIQNQNKIFQVDEKAMTRNQQSSFFPFQGPVVQN